MGYMHIDNLYKNVDIMNFKECYALEKIHGTSAHISWKENVLTFFSGGEKHAKFLELFNEEEMTEYFKEHFTDIDITLFGEAYGGKCQGMSETYGKELKFIVFDVKIGEAWLNVSNAEDVTNNMGLEFVDYVKCNTDLVTLNYYRDLPSSQAIRNDMGEDKLREGIVLRPLEEYSDKRGNRVIVKHKRDEFKETATKREVDPEKLILIEKANEIAKEWVTPMRLNHILDKADFEPIIENTRKVIGLMLEDVYREAKDEIIESVASDKAIGRLTAQLYKKHTSKI